MRIYKRIKELIVSDVKTVFKNGKIKKEEKLFWIVVKKNLSLKG